MDPTSAPVFIYQANQFLFARARSLACLLGRQRRASFARANEQPNDDVSGRERAPKNPVVSACLPVEAGIITMEAQIGELSSEH